MQVPDRTVLFIPDWRISNCCRQVRTLRCKDMRRWQFKSAIALCGVPLTIVEPSAWKKFHGLRGSDKELSRQRALQLFPAAHALLAHKKDHGRAEAMLVALFGAHSFGARSSSSAGSVPVRSDSEDLHSASRSA